MWLNIDLGERADEDPRLFACAHIANIACGGHAGDAASMRESILRCRDAGTTVAAHPSFVDREHFGRRHVAVPPAVLRDQIAEQLQALFTHAAAAAMPLRIVKPHGALYHAASAHSEVADVLLDAAESILGPRPTIVGSARGALRTQTLARGGEFLIEGFADRGRRPGDQGGWELVPRGEPGALLQSAEAVLAQYAALRAEAEVDTLCLHGDHPQALEFALLLRSRLDEAGIAPPQPSARPA